MQPKRVTFLAVAGRLRRLRVNHRGAALLYAAAALVLLAPVLLGDRALSPSSLLYFSPPWTAAKPDDVLDYFNPVLSDIPTAYFPWWDYARDAIHDGVLPQWNPYALAGTPFYANPQSALLSPFNLLPWTLPIGKSLGVLAGVQLWLTAFGTYLFARQLRLMFAPALLAGFAFGFSPFAIVWLTYPLLSVLALLPWSLWLVERTLRRAHRADPLALGLVLAAALLAGHPGSQVHLYAVTGAYALLRAASLRAVDWRARVVGLGFVAAALALGLAIAAVALLPAALALSGTVGLEVRSSGALTLPDAAMRTLFFPDWWGRPSDIWLPAPANYNEGTLYAGTVAFVLAVLALLTRDRVRDKLPFVLMALIGFQAAFALEPTQTMLEHAPVIRNDRNARLSLLVQLGVAMLAGFALQRLLERRGGTPKIAAVLTGAGIVGLLGLVIAGPSVDDLRVVGNHFLTGNDYAIADVIQTTTVAWWLLLVTSLGIVLLLIRPRATPVITAAAVLALVVFDAAHFSRGYNPMPPDQHAFPDAPEAVRFLQARAGVERVTGLGVTLPPDTSTVYELRDIRGNDPPMPTLRYMNLFRLINPTQPTGDWLAIPSLDERGKRVLDLLNVRWIMLPPGSPTLELPGLSLAYRQADADIYRNDTAAPRAFVPAAVRTVESEQEALATVASSTFAPLRIAAVEGGVVQAGRGSVEVVRDRPSALELDVRLSRGGLVVVPDVLLDGWHVEIDGRKAEALRVNSILRGVDVPDGRHIVRWSYRTPGLRAGAAISGLGLLAALGWGAFLFVRRRQSAAAA